MSRNPRSYRKEEASQPEPTLWWHGAFLIWANPGSQNSKIPRATPRAQPAVKCPLVLEDGIPRLPAGQIDLIPGSCILWLHYFSPKTSWWQPLSVADGRKLCSFQLNSAWTVKWAGGWRIQIELHLEIPHPLIHTGDPWGKVVREGPMVSVFISSMTTIIRKAPFCILCLLFFSLLNKSQWMRPLSEFAIIDTRVSTRKLQGRKKKQK